MNAEPIDVRPKPQAALRKRSGIKIHHVFNDLVEVDGLRLGAPYKRSYAGIGDPVVINMLYLNESGITNSAIAARSIFSSTTTVVVI